MSITRCRIVAGLTACGLTLSLAASPARAVDPALVAAAKKEGQFNWYTTLVVTQVVRPLAQAFEKKYGIKVNFVPAPWQETALRITNEGRANAIKADLFDGAPTFFPLNAAGLVDAYKPEAAKNFPDDMKEPNGLWTAHILQPATPAVNTDAVDKKDFPKTYEDLLQPKWKGKMGWTTSPSAAGPVGFIGNILLTMGKDKGMDYLRKLAAQKIANIPSNQRVVLDQAIAGQYPLVLSIYNYHAAISAAQGAPIEWLKLDPAVMHIGLFGLIKGSPNPNAARLFVEFALSDEGEQIQADAGYIPVSPNVQAKRPELKPGPGTYNARLITPEMYAQHEAEWLAIYKSLFE
ncbi:ABC transporter substrate-binding protein [Chelatococcus sp. GCM10030263]|uniref:ABC transporter substrate-binding protein n=1 Tax=Chelatococcus sp. GCM10030263 TaxID=3273387 RepID=UPI00360FF5EC